MIREKLGGDKKEGDGEKLLARNEGVRTLKNAGP